VKELIESPGATMAPWGFEEIMQNATNGDNEISEIFTNWYYRKCDINSLRIQEVDSSQNEEVTDQIESEASLKFKPKYELGSHPLQINSVSNLTL